MEAIEKQLHASNRLLEERAAADPACTRLMGGPGVGPITSLTFTASVEDPQRFAKREDVGAYAGLAPRRSQLGERDVHGHISKAGDPMCDEHFLKLPTLRCAASSDRLRSKHGASGSLKPKATSARGLRLPVNWLCCFIRLG